MKKMKKGFTIVELVIVIAVIAILAAVLIPTFTSVTDRAKESAALQEARNAYTVAYADAIADGYINEADDQDKDDPTTDAVEGTEGIQIYSADNKYVFTFDENGKLTEVDCTSGEYKDYIFKVNADGTISVEKN